MAQGMCRMPHHEDFGLIGAVQVFEPAGIVQDVFLDTRSQLTSPILRTFQTNLKQSISSG